MSKNEFHPGDKLPAERALAKSFGVSRSSVREAIRTLSEKGLLESRQGDGTYLCKPCKDSLKDALITAVGEESNLFDSVMEFRMVFEPNVAELAASRITKERLDQLKVVTCNQHLCYLSQEDDTNLDAEFHQLIAESTGNPLFIETAKKLTKAYCKGRNPDLRDHGWKKKSLDGHLRIIEALESHSPEAAKLATIEHLEMIMSSHPFVIIRD
jgi:GntR family transcriptional repressor for pyruvate dehydrogenase complex